MKKILSLVMVVAMLVAVLALVGCNTTNQPNDTAADTTAADTTAADTTAADTTAADTTAADTTTLPPVFARFDFGTKSKAQDLKMTSHEYLTKALTYDEAFISVDYTEDSIIVTAVQDHPEIVTELDEDGDPVEKPGDRYAVTSYALCFEDLVTYDFDDELKKESNFMRFRIKNNTTNNMMAFRWHKAGQAYATTLLASCMYLQGGAPTVDDYVAGEHKLTCEASEAYGVYTYDINFLAAMGRHTARGEWQGNSYVHMAYNVGVGGSTGSNNWNWLGTEAVTSVQFFVLGAFGGAAYRKGFEFADTRANIVKGATVEIDYIIFGAKADLNSFTSYDQDVYNESVSISKSISVAESEAAAATATTAA